MIKYTILYKNGKTWNGKAKYFSDVSATDCLCVIFREGDTVHATTPYHHMVTGWHWNTPKFVGYSLTGYTRTPNPKSKTKKQKAFDEAYRKWVYDMGELNDGKRGNLDFSIKAYKKWLFQQKSSSAIKCFPSFSVGDKIGYYPQGSDELTWCTITEAGYTSPNTISIKAQTSGEIDKAIGQIQLSYEEPEQEEHLTEVAGALPEYKVALYTNDAPQKIAFPSGATLSWDGAYKPWKVSALSKFKIEAKKVADGESSYILLNVDYDYPIKTTYTFWLGANGEVVDDD